MYEFNADSWTFFDGQSTAYLVSCSSVGKVEVSFSEAFC